jgi:hypothetical protein
MMIRRRMMIMMIIHYCTLHAPPRERPRAGTALAESAIQGYV